MLARLAILGFMAAAVATLLDRGTLWQFTLDPERRLAMTAYWALHAILLVLIVLAYQSLARAAKPTVIAVLTLLVIASLGFVFGGLLIADVVTLIRLAFVDHAPVIIAIVVGALLVRMLWRVFSDSKPLLTKSGENDDAATWSDALRSIVVVPFAVVGFFWLTAVLTSTWRTASLVLDYALLGSDPATLDWSYGLHRIADYIVHWEIMAFLAGAMILAVILEKLFAGPTNGSQ